MNPKSLFSENGPSIEDVEQGNIDDCWLLAAMIALVRHDWGHQVIYNNMCIINGRVFVRLYVNNKDVMNNQLEGASQPIILEVPDGFPSATAKRCTDKVCWPAYLEKALTFLDIHGGNIEGRVARAEIAAYENLDFGGSNLALGAITGHQYRSKEISHPTKIFKGPDEEDIKASKKICQTWKEISVHDENYRGLEGNCIPREYGYVIVALLFGYHDNPKVKEILQKCDPTGPKRELQVHEHFVNTLAKIFSIIFPKTNRPNLEEYFRTVASRMIKWSLEMMKSSNYNRFNQGLKINNQISDELYESYNGEKIISYLSKIKCSDEHGHQSPLFTQEETLSIHKLLKDTAVIHGDVGSGYYTPAMINLFDTITFCCKNEIPLTVSTREMINAKYGLTSEKYRGLVACHAYAVLGTSAAPIDLGEEYNFRTRSLSRNRGLRYITVANPWASYGRVYTPITYQTMQPKILSAVKGTFNVELCEFFQNFGTIYIPEKELDYYFENRTLTSKDPTKKVFNLKARDYKMCFEDIW